MSEKQFYLIGCGITKHNPEGSIVVGRRRFVATFGVHANICSILWNRIETKPINSEPIHLLFALMFLKKYDTEEGNHISANVDEKTFRKWCWIFVEELAVMRVINFDKRYQNSLRHQFVYNSIDGTDCPIQEPQEPTPFSPRWYSHKFHRAGLRYEVAVSILNGDIVWAHGGKPAGAWPDLKIARSLYVGFTDRGEKTLADRGCRDNRYFVLRNTQNEILHKKLLARHETVNSRLKAIRVLSGKFRHRISKHPRCFHAVANIVQIEIENGCPIFQVTDNLRNIICHTL